MKYTRITALAAVSLAATLSLTACDNGSGQDSSSKGSSSAAASSSDGGSKPAGSSSESSSGSDSSSSSSAGSTASKGSSGSGEDTEARAGAANGGTASSGKLPICKTADLAIDAADASPDGKAGIIDITMVNRGSTTCSASGYAGVDITDADHTSEPITRGKAVPRITNLKPGDAAVFNLSYTIDPTGKSYTHPTKLEVTPPNETHTVSVKWPAGAGQVKGSYVGVEVYPTHNK